MKSDAHTETAVVESVATRMLKSRSDTSSLRCKCEINECRFFYLLALLAMAVLSPSLLSSVSLNHSTQTLHMHIRRFWALRSIHIQASNLLYRCKFIYIYSVICTQCSATIIANRNLKISFNATKPTLVLLTICKCSLNWTVYTIFSRFCLCTLVFSLSVPVGRTFP